MTHLTDERCIMLEGKGVIFSFFFILPHVTFSFFAYYINLEGEGGPFPIAVTINSLDKLTIEHLKSEDHDKLDTGFGNHGRTELSDDFWILEEETSNKKQMS